MNFDNINRFRENLGKWVGRRLAHLKPAKFSDGLRTSRLFRSIAAQFIITGMIAGMFYVITSWLWASCFWAAVLWTVILCYTPVFSMWFICPHENYAVVLADRLRKERELVTDEELTKLQSSRVMRVCFGPTFDGKLPWEEIVNGKIVNMLRSVPLKGTLSVITLNGVECFVDWQMFLSPISAPWAVINLVQHTEEKITGTFTGCAEAYIESAVKGMTDDVLFTELDRHAAGVQIPVGHATLTNGFSMLFLGDDKLSPIEREMGMKTQYLIVKKVRLNPKFQKAKQVTAIAEQVMPAIQKYIAAGITGDVAANMVASDRDEEHPSTINRQAFSGIPPGARVLVGGIDVDTPKH